MVNSQDWTQNQPTISLQDTRRLHINIDGVVWQVLKILSQVFYAWFKALADEIYANMPIGLPFPVQMVLNEFRDVELDEEARWFMLDTILSLPFGKAYREANPVFVEDAA
jgi:hypothetical protein